MMTTRRGDNDDGTTYSQMVIETAYTNPYEYSLTRKSIRIIHAVQVVRIISPGENKF